CCSLSCSRSHLVPHSFPTRRSSDLVPTSAFRLFMYVELHCHSAYSFLDGASLPEQLALTASQLGYFALALTDHNGLYGEREGEVDRKSTRLNSSHVAISYAVFCLKK